MLHACKEAGFVCKPKHPAPLLPARLQSHIGNGVSFLNRTLSAKMFSPNANAEGRCGKGAVWGEDGGNLLC